jgi:signal transduction histidine kinase
MAERVQLLGGTVSAAEVPGAGFRVEVTLPGVVGSARG